jgi:hypothetical protein
VASYRSPRGYPTGALLVGIGKTSGGIAKKIGFAAGKLEQPLLRHRVGLMVPSARMWPGVTRARPGAADQQTAVAIERLAPEHRRHTDDAASHR